MIETEQQRRWWFATHPEFSSSHAGERRRRHDDDDEDEDSGRPSPEEVDAWADKRLEYERDNVARTLVELTKFYFGTEFQSKTPEEKEAILRADEDWPEDDDGPANAAGNDWWSQQPDDSPTRGEDTYLSYKDVLNLLDRREAEESAKAAFMREMMNAGWSRDRAEERWKVYKLNEGVARGVSNAMNVYGAIAGARAILSGAYRWFIGLGEAGALRLSGSSHISRIGSATSQEGGPGKWVEVCRPHGIEHQSKMSGKPIIERGGKRYIEEYMVPSEPRPVYFDDFQHGVYIEHKGPQGNLLNKDKMFDPWFRGAIDNRDQAISQVRAAKGAPVIWKVGADQVKAFQKLLSGIDGITIMP